MVKLNRKLDSTEYLTESKQVGDLPGNLGASIVEYLEGIKG